MGQDERRKFQRQKKQSVISFYVVGDKGKDKDIEAVVIDSSKAGVRFRVKNSLPKNAKIYIKLDSEEWGEELTYFCKDTGLGLVEMIGSVMWCLESQHAPGEFEVGTRFVGQVEH